MKKTKWLLYTVMVGLIPFFIRLLIFIFDKTAPLSFCLNETDFILLGLVLNLNNVNELEDKTFENKKWKTLTVGISTILIGILSVILGLLMYFDFKHIKDLNRTNVLICSITLATVSLIFSYSIYNRLTKLSYE